MATGLGRKQGKHTVDLTILRFRDGSWTTAGPMHNMKFEYNELGSWMHRVCVVRSTLGKAAAEKPIAYLVRATVQAAAFYASHRRLGPSPVRAAMVTYAAPSPTDVCYARSSWLIAVVAFALGVLIASTWNWMRTPRKPRTTARLMQTDFGELVYFTTTAPGCLHVRKNCAALEEVRLRRCTIVQLFNKQDLDDVGWL